MGDLSINQKLLEAVENFNTRLVKTCLENGADPNYRSEDHEETRPHSDLQPNTPLKMVVFRISDSLLMEEDLRHFSVIAELLLEYGADPEPALQMAEKRYGKYDTELSDSPLMSVYHVIRKAHIGRHG